MTPNPEKKHQGKVAIITGASRGIGRAIALRFVENGADLVLSYQKNKAAIEEVAKHCLALSGKAPLVVEGDLGETSTIDEIVGQAMDHFGAVHILVNNAGVAVDDLLATLTDQDIEWMIATNITGLVRLCRAVLRPMIKARQGCIINLSSAVAQRPSRGNSVYAGTKGFVEAFTQSLAIELGSKKIRVNAVAPGVIDTAMSKGVQAIAGERLLSNIALGRLGTTEEVAHLVSFLASDEARYINGAVVAIDGAIHGW